jgi:putative transposase
MKKSKFSEEQIAFALRQADGGTPVGDVCRQLGVSEVTFYVWKKKTPSEFAQHGQQTRTDEGSKFSL